MKKFVLPLMMTLMISSTVFAQSGPAISAGLGASAAAIGIGVSTGNTGCHGDTCDGPLISATGMSTLAPIIGLVISVVGSSHANKEEIAVAKNDSILFVAGFEKSELLQTLISELRMKEAKLQKYNDHEIALALALGLK